MVTIITKLEEFDPIIGDDLPVYSMKLKKVPTGFHFEDLTIDETMHPLSYALKDKLFAFAESYYRNYEIVGETIVDWFTNLTNDLNLNLDTFEKMMKVYYDDIANPTQSRTIKRTVESKDVRTPNLTQTESGKPSSDGTTTDYAITEDNGDVYGTDKTIVHNESNLDSTVVNSGTETNEHNETNIEDWSDVGVAPNYELLNGFLDNNVTYYAEFVKYFRNDFTLTEALKW